MILQVGLCCHHAVARNDFRLIIGDGQHFVGGSNKASDVTAATGVDKRETYPEHKQITHVNDIGFGPIDDRVAVSVACRHMDNTDFFAVKVKLHTICISDDR